MRKRSRLGGAVATSHASQRQPERAMTTAITPEWLFGHIGGTAGGSVEWGRPVPERGCGVYIITVADAIEGQHVVYIGRTSRPLRVRLGEFYRHRYGDSKPHSGGQEILKLTSPRTVHWAVVMHCATAEDVMLEAFRDAVGRLPYANKMRSARMTPISN